MSISIVGKVPRPIYRLIWTRLRKWCRFHGCVCVGVKSKCKRSPIWSIGQKTAGQETTCLWHGQECYSFFSEGVHSNKQTDDQYFFEIEFSFEFCFSLHGMQYVLLSHTATGKYYFNFSGSMVPNFHGTA